MSAYSPNNCLQAALYGYARILKRMPFACKGLRVDGRLNYWKLRERMKGNDIED